MAAAKGWLLLLQVVALGLALVVAADLLAGRRSPTSTNQMPIAPNNPYRRPCHMRGGRTSLGSNESRVSQMGPGALR